jgi:hypothetical protein
LFVTNIEGGLVWFDFFKYNTRGWSLSGGSLAAVQFIVGWKSRQKLIAKAEVTDLLVGQTVFNLGNPAVFAV